MSRTDFEGSDNSRGRRSYHHGDLRNALIDGAVELIAERGVRGFSLAEVGRRAGVSAAAPYRHFADREALLAAVAVRALNEFSELIVGAAPESLTAEQRLEAIVAAYVRFAGERRALFESVFAAGIDKARHPEVHEAEAPIDAVILACTGQLCADDDFWARALGRALAATAHGYSVLLIDGLYAGEPDPIATASNKATVAAKALIRGREAFLEEGR